MFVGSGHIQLLKNLVKKNLSSSDRKRKINNKIIEIYCKDGNYKKALVVAKENYSNYPDIESQYTFEVIDIMSQDSKSVSSSLNYYEEITNEFNIIKTLDKLNNSICYNDKFEHICSYVRGEGAFPLFFNLTNKGVNIENKGKSEKELINNFDTYVRNRGDWLKQGQVPNYIKNLYDNNELEHLDSLFNGSVPYVKATKIAQSDFSNSLLSVSGGLRTTLSQPMDFDRRLLIFGSSSTFSLGVSDRDTIASCLQRLLNENGYKIKVENHGVIGLNLITAVNNLTQTQITEGDIVVFFDFDEVNELQDDVVFRIDLNNIERGDDFFLDLTKKNCHLSKYGYDKISRVIFNRLTGPLNHQMRMEPKIKLDNRMDLVLDRVKHLLYKEVSKITESCEVKNYLSNLRDYAPDFRLKVGSVAVNCNPITNGHLHLLEHASSSVDKLFVFVIEEDKSFFKFNDRLHLVEESTKHLGNVTVLRGGKLICTELTYPDYFDKETSKAKADASMEAWFFCEYIAKTLNISKIFLGNEPKCQITQQYNEKMQELLPEYGIEVEIIERISTNGDVISASKVREFLASRDFSSIEAIVPKPTYQFLKENY
ncbi:citrate lyase ligase [Vibrio gigantis]|uniref:citrate lyase ligase n=1 Tax=Vibrio gigantis TaxID=296199 RepID=UPI001EFA433A|nr:citrate lyase ligase [Vibrio gigantis]ULN65871.1 citrate lyase ligase [Vibrio gigantis]